MFFSMQTPPKRTTANAFLLTLLAIAQANALGGSAWVHAYAFEWALLIAAAAASPYIGLVGFFSITAISGFITTVSLLAASTSFLSGNNVYSINTGGAGTLTHAVTHFNLYIDALGFSFGLLTSTIGCFAYVYGFSYMRFEKNALNFLVYLQTFKLSMMLLV